MASPDADVKPYKVKVSSKYLDLTKQKLELTRLPHEESGSKGENVWERKAQVESIIDYWLEKYSWRDQEDALNRSLPHFRATIPTPSLEIRLRLHFVHVRSAHANAVPLLLLPPFPFSNLSLGHLVKLFTDPEDAAHNTPFHLVIPSFPGVGFSDSLPPNAPVIPTVADMLDTLMKRLAYPRYLVTNAGAGHASPAAIDWRLADQLARQHSTSCLGAHLISPPLSPPRLVDAPWEWAKWVIACFFKVDGRLGYTREDFATLGRRRSGRVSAVISTRSSSISAPANNPQQLGLNKLGLLREPNALAYSLCDSPVGVLVLFLKGLRMLSPRVDLTHDQIVTLTNLMWLPGPEYVLRFWSRCLFELEEGGNKKAKGQKETPVFKPRVGITVFLGGRSENSEPVTAPASQGSDNPDGEEEEEDYYVPPAWGYTRYDVVHAQRVTGRSGLLAWERPGVIATGVRGLAREILKLDQRLVETPPSTTIPPTTVAPLEQVVVGGGVEREAAEPQPTNVTADEPARKTQPSGSATAGTGPSAITGGEQRRDKGKGKAVDLRPPPPLRDPFFASDGESPDTLVDSTPLLDAA